jgi:hypothetical protein
MPGRGPGLRHRPRGALRTRLALTASRAARFSGWIKELSRARSLGSPTSSRVDGWTDAASRLTHRHARFPGECKCDDRATRRFCCGRAAGVPDATTARPGRERLSAARLAAPHYLPYLRHTGRLACPGAAARLLGHVARADTTARLGGARSCRRCRAARGVRANSRVAPGTLARPRESRRGRPGRSRGLPRLQFGA